MSNPCDFANSSSMVCLVALVALAAAASLPVAASADPGTCVGAEELEESSLLQRAPLTSPARALRQESARSPEQPEGFFLIEDAFQFYDLDGDLRITVEDLKGIADLEAANGDLLGEPGGGDSFSKPALQHMISQLDADGSGCVCLEEFDKASQKDTSQTGTKEDARETRMMMEVLNELSTNLSLVERGNLSMFEQLEQVRQKAKAMRRAKRAGRLAKLKAGWPWSRRRAPPVAKPRWTGDHGEVHQVFTFGAPAVADPALRNGRTGNGRFQGLRVVSNDRVPGVFWEYWMKTDPVTWLVRIVGFEHSLMDVLVLKKFSQMEPEHKSFLSESALHSFPSSDNPLWHFSLHYSDTYKELAFAQSHWPEVQRTFVYSAEVYNSREGLHAAAQRYGARVVEYFDVNEDSAGLIQDESTLDCTLVFSGSDNTGDWVNNIRIYGATFCGFPDVHAGFRAEMVKILSADYWQNNFRTKLPKCGKLYTTGHSLGGALASLFAACANRVDLPADDDDANLLRWTPATPELLETKTA